MVLRAWAIEMALEVASECLDLAKVMPCGDLGVITTLEPVQHDLEWMGHTDLLVPQFISCRYNWVNRT